MGIFQSRFAYTTPHPAANLFVGAPWLLTPDDVRRDDNPENALRWENGDSFAGTMVADGRPVMIKVLSDPVDPTTDSRLNPSENTEEGEERLRLLHAECAAMAQIPATCITIARFLGIVTFPDYVPSQMIFEDGPRFCVVEQRPIPSARVCALGCDILGGLAAIEAVMSRPLHDGIMYESLLRTRPGLIKIPLIQMANGLNYEAPLIYVAPEHRERAPPFSPTQVVLGADPEHEAEYIASNTFAFGILLLKMTIDAKEIMAPHDSATVHTKAHVALAKLTDDHLGALIDDCLATDPAARPTRAQLLTRLREHPLMAAMLNSKLRYMM